MGWTMALSKSNTTFLSSLTIWQFKVHNMYLLLRFRIIKIRHFGKRIWSTGQLKLSWVFTLPKYSWFAILCPICTDRKYHVILCFNFFPLFAILPFWAYPLVGKALKNHPLSSIFQIYFSSYPLQSSLILSIQDSTVVCETSRDSPDVCYSLMPWLNFQRYDALKSTNSVLFSDCFMFILLLAKVHWHKCQMLHISCTMYTKFR